MPDPRDPKASIEFLKSLPARIKPASEHFAGELAAPRPAPKPRAAPSLADLLPHAERIAFNGMACACVETVAPLDGSRTPQGCLCPAARFAPASTEAFLAALAVLARDARWRDLDLESIAFIDTETTSLGGGSGTYVFLIGVGRFVGGAFSVRQYFMEDLSAEEAMIEAAGFDLGSAKALVSYNGKCFDVPLMEARWRMQRRRPRFPELHLDLLHPARRLWRARLGDCRLSTVERAILGVERVSDVPSAMIPSIYFEFLRGVYPERIIPVLDHHAQDIFSLGALARAMAAGVAEPGHASFAHAADQWGLSGIFQAAGDAEESLRRLEAAAVSARDEDFGFRLAMHLARRLARMDRAGEAAAIWEARAEQARAGRLEPLIELAKHAERRLKDFPLARRWAERAFEIAMAERETAPTLAAAAARKRAGETPEELAKRIDRLRRRAAP